MIDKEFEKELKGKGYAGYNNILNKTRESIKSSFKKRYPTKKESKSKEKKEKEKKLLYVGKLLKKPQVKLVQPLNSEKAIMQGTRNLALVREVEKKEYEPDNRSLFFNETFIKEKDRGRKWLLE